MINEQNLSHVRKMFSEIGGEDMGRPGLEKTPMRYLRSLEFLCSGYTTDIPKIVNGAIYHIESSDLVLVKGIEFYSLCEHHLLPFFGKCHVAYIPNGKIIGLSKVPRIVDVYCRRMQVQERLTHQIAMELQSILKPKGVAVSMEASHLCMMMRGVQKQGSSTVSTSYLGCFDDTTLRREFLDMIKAG